MASIFNSKHNKYVSIPDWFKDTDLSTELPAETKTTYIGGASGAVASGTGMSDIVLHNKFVLKEVTVSSDILVIQDTALNVIESAKNELTNSTTQSEEQPIKIGDELQVIGWGTSAYIEIAAGSTMTINASISELYGLVFYDNTKTVISGIGLSSSPIEIAVPVNASYYRISSELNIDSFSILYQKPIAYNSEQLETSNLNITDYVLLNEEIPEGINTVTYTDTLLKLLVQSPLSLTKDINNVVKLSIGEITTTSSINDMFVWDKKLAAFGYDATAGTAYSYIDGLQLFTTDEEGNEIPVTTTNSEFWLYDDSLENLWIIKSTRPRISWLDNLVEYNDEKNCFIFHGNVLTTGGITMYAEDGDIGGGGTGGTIPNLEELKKLFVTTDELAQNVVGIKTFENGLKIGDEKIYQYNEGIIKIDAHLLVSGGITMYHQDGEISIDDWYVGLPIQDPLYWDYSSGSAVLSVKNTGTIYSITVTGDGNAITGATLSSDGKSINFTKSIKFPTLEDLLKKADKEYVDLNFVTLKTELIIEGKKDFTTGGLFVNGNQIIYDTDTDCWRLDGNLIVTGGITMYAIDPAEIPSFMQSLLLDPKTLKLNDNGYLTVIGGGGGSIGYPLSWSGFSSGSWDGTSEKNIYIPSKTSELTNDASFVKLTEMNTALAKYLPLTGGTLTGDLRLKDDTDYGRTLYFGDGSYAYITEDSDDHLNIYASNGVSINGYEALTAGNYTDYFDSDDYVTELGLESNGKYDRYLTYTKGGTVNRLTVGYATYANRLLAFGATDLNATDVWNTNIGLKSSWFASSASNKPATAGTSANGVITFMPATSYGFQLAYLNQLSAGYDGVTHLYVRNYVNGSYKGWYRLVTDGPQMTFDTYASGYMRLRYLTQDWYYLRAYSDGLWIGLSQTNGININSAGRLHTTGHINVGTIYTRGNIVLSDHSIYFSSNVSSGSSHWRIIGYGKGIQFNYADYTGDPETVASYTGVLQLNSTIITAKTDFLCNGGITMYSDERKKTILRHVELSLKEVAEAPLIEHYYNSDDKKTTHVGSIAQYWAGLNDWFCKKDSEGFYTMEIQNAALASSISVARELLRYENETDRRIQLLEKENHILKNEIENLRKNK